MSEIVEFGCPCCDYTLRMTRENAGRIAKAVKLRYSNGQSGVYAVTFDMAKVPDDLDLTVPVDAATIRRIVELCVRAV